MENRRKNYRHLFQPVERIRAELESSRRAKVHGEVLDISVEGVRVQLDGQPPFTPQDHVVVRLTLPEQVAPLTLAALVVYVQRGPEGWECGLRFLALVDPAAQTARDRLLSRYVLEQQRQSIRKGRAEPIKIRLVHDE